MIIKADLLSADVSSYNGVNEYSSVNFRSALYKTCFSCKLLQSLSAINITSLPLKLFCKSYRTIPLSSILFLPE
jgi:hypothetical protein